MGGAGGQCACVQQRCGYIDFALGILLQRRRAKPRRLTAAFRELDRHATHIRRDEIRQQARHLPRTRGNDGLALANGIAQISRLHGSPCRYLDTDIDHQAKRARRLVGLHDHAPVDPIAAELHGKATIRRKRNIYLMAAIIDPETDRAVIGRGLVRHDDTQPNLVTALQGQFFKHDLRRDQPGVRHGACPGRHRAHRQRDDRAGAPKRRGSYPFSNPCFQKLHSIRRLTHHPHRKTRSRPALSRNCRQNIIHPQAPTATRPALPSHFRNQLPC